MKKPQEEKLANRYKDTDDTFQGCTARSEGNWALLCQKQTISVILLTNQLERQEIFWNIDF
jgi:hypothetical protein